MTPDTVTTSIMATEASSEGYKLYYPDGKYLVPNLVAEGTDGSLYLVPSEPGGWLKRWIYEGPKRNLTPVSRAKAASLIRYLYGDIGSVQVAGAAWAAGSGQGQDWVEIGSSLLV